MNLKRKRKNWCTYSVGGYHVLHRLRTIISYILICTNLLKDVVVYICMCINATEPLKPYCFWRDTVKHCAVVPGTVFVLL